MACVASGFFVGARDAEFASGKATRRARAVKPPKPRKISLSPLHFPCGFALANSALPAPTKPPIATTQASVLTKIDVRVVTETCNLFF